MVFRFPWIIFLFFSHFPHNFLLFYRLPLLEDCEVCPTCLGVHHASFIFDTCWTWFNNWNTWNHTLKFCDDILGCCSFYMTRSIISAWKFGRVHMAIWRSKGQRPSLILWKSWLRSLIPAYKFGTVHTLWVKKKRLNQLAEHRPSVKVCPCQNFRLSTNRQTYNPQSTDRNLNMYFTTSEHLAWLLFWRVLRIH